MVARPGCDWECHEFFKVYFPDQSSRQLRIPPAFVKQFGGTIPRNAKLVDVSGKSWHVEVAEAENNLFFKNGWQKFAIDHSLKLGNFLVFSYTGNSVYDVTIFRNNGCVNEEVLAKQCMVEETLAVQKFTKIKEEPEEDRPYPKPSPSCGSQQKYIKVHLQGSGKTKARGSCEVSRRKSRRIGPMTSGLTSEVLEFTTPTNPHFIATFYPRTFCQLNIPRSVLDEIKTEMKPEMVLCGENGNRWPVRVLSSDDGKRVFSRGWAKFARDNNFKLDDQCMFEFVFCRTRRLSSEVKFQIRRANSGALLTNQRD